jgi:Ca-activated chloride channel family protein
MFLGSATAASLALKAEPASRLLKASEKQTTFIKIALKNLNPEREERTPVNVALVIDQSGSMQGERMTRAKEAAMLAIDFLNDEDHVSVVTYNSSVHVVVPATPVHNRPAIKAAIRALQPAGNTALFAGVARGAGEVRQHLSPYRINRIILISDGLANVGPSTPGALGELGRSLGSQGISVTTIGLGLGYNEDLMSRLAGASDGNHAFAENASDLLPLFNNEFGDLFSVVAQEVEISIRFSPSVTPIRVLGREAMIDGHSVRSRINQISGEQEKYLIVEVEISGGKPGEQQEIASVDARYLDVHTRQHKKLDQTITIGYSNSARDISASASPSVAEAALIQQTNEVSKQAVELRDEGRIEEAKSLLRSNADTLRAGAASLGSEQLRSLEMQTRTDEAEIAKEDWDKNRKELIERQYKLEKQQSY